MILASERFNATSDRLNDVSNWRESSHFTDREKAALAFAEATAKVPNGVTEEISSALKVHWSDGDIVEIMGVCALFGFLNRWNDSMGSKLEDLPITAGEKFLAQSTGWEIGKHG